MHDVGEDDTDVGVFGADSVLEAGGEKAVVFWSLLPSDKSVSFGEAGEGVRGGLTKVVMIYQQSLIFLYVNKNHKHLANENMFLFISTEKIIP